MNKLTQTKSTAFAFIFFLLIFLHSFHYLDYKKFDPTIGGWVHQILCVLLIGLILINKIRIRNAYSKNFVLAFLFVPMLSILPAAIERDQPIISSLHAFLFFTVIFIYFFLYKYRISEKLVIKFILFLAVIRIIITIYQQYTYPSYWFVPPGRSILGSNADEVEIRSGIYRFLISDTFLTMILIFYSWQKLLIKISFKYITMLVFGLIGLYLDQSRQFIASTLGILAISPMLNNKSKGKIYPIILVATVFVLIFINFQVLFSDLSDITTDIDKDYTRITAYDFYLNNYWKGPITVLFGNGLPAYHSNYEIQIGRIQDFDKLFRVDIGIVGGLNQYGIATIVTFISFYVFLFRKYWKKIDLYLRMFLISALFNILLIFPLIMAPYYWIFWGVIMFLIDKSINKNIKAENLYKRKLQLLSKENIK